ncbi:MAG: hypothetical protein HYZ53_19645 [Planctomycetes bacterium]|nr:hypothetical protein [Planctomycetota bacterium]
MSANVRARTGAFALLELIFVMITIGLLAGLMLSGGVPDPKKKPQPKLVVRFLEAPAILNHGDAAVYRVRCERITEEGETVPEVNLPVGFQLNVPPRALILRYWDAEGKERTTGWKGAASAATLTDAKGEAAVELEGELEGAGNLTATASVITNAGGITMSATEIACFLVK